MLNWQEIKGESHDPFKRARVQNGWLVNSGYNEGRPGTITFYKDPVHEWDGKLIDLK